MSVAFRAFLASFYEPGTVMMSEVYDGSVKSTRVLVRCGFQRLINVPASVHQHAYDANPIDPVKHMALSPWALPELARKLLGLVHGDCSGRPGATLSYRFDRAYGFDDPAMRAALELLADRQLGVVGHYGPEPDNLELWMAELTGEPCITFDLFARLQQRRLDGGSGND